MACVEVKKIIKDFSSYFGKEIDDLNFSFDKVPVARVGKNEVLGLRNIVSQVSGSINPEYDAVQDEWVEYALIHLGNLESSAVTQVLKELNSYIMDKVYFVGNQLGPVDVLLYYILYSAVLNLTFQEKEKYLHFSRWFNNVQHSQKTRLWRSVIPFSKSLLYAYAGKGGGHPFFKVVKTNPGDPQLITDIQGNSIISGDDGWTGLLFRSFDDLGVIAEELPRLPVSLHCCRLVSSTYVVFDRLMRRKSSLMYECWTSCEELTWSSSDDANSWMMSSEGMADCVVPLKEAKRFLKDCLLAVNTIPENADQLAEVLVAADYRGHYSHGLNRLPIYVTDVKAGVCDQNAKPKILNETPATAWVDGQNSLGPVVGNFCMDVAVEKAKNCGIGWVAAKNSNHFGIAGWYTLRALEHNMIGMSFTNTSPFLCPTRAKEAALGTNPISVAAPGENGDSFFLDMATTAVAVGKIEIQQRKNEPIPEGWAVDENGLPTTDPNVAQQSRRLMPLGGSELTSGYKGYGLCHMVELFCGVLAGAAYGPNIRKWGSIDRKADLGQCFVAINPECFAPGFKARVTDLNEYLRRLPPADPSNPVLIAGDLEKERMAVVDREGGIRYHVNQIKAANEIAENLKVAPLQLQKSLVN